MSGQDPIWSVLELSHVGMASSYMAVRAGYVFNYFLESLLN